MRPLKPLTVGGLALCVLAFAPSAEAQVPTDHDPPPAPHQIQAERELMQQRFDEHQRAWTDLERRTATLRDEQIRTDLDRQIADLIERRTALDREFAQLETVAPEDFHDRRRAIDEQFRDIEQRTVEARFRAAESPADFRRVARHYMDMHRQYMRQHHERVQTLPAERRAEASLELIQLRRQHDNLQRRFAQIERAPAATFTELRQPFTRDLTTLHTEVHRTDFEWRMDPDVVAGAR